MTALVAPSSVEHDFGYDMVNQNIEYVTPLSGSYLYEYDGDRRLVTVKFPSFASSGRRIDNVYSQGRLGQTQTVEGGVVKDTTDFAYNAGGMLASVTKGAEAIAYGYDGSLLTSDIRTPGATEFQAVVS